MYGNSGPGFGQAQNCGGVKLVIGIPTTPVLILSAKSSHSNIVFCLYFRNSICLAHMAVLMLINIIIKTVIFLLMRFTHVVGVVVAVIVW